MAKYVGYKRPKDTKKTVKHLLSYLGHYKWAFLLIAILVFISAGAGIMGTFLIKPVVNNFIVPGNMKGLIIAVCGMVSCMRAVRSQRLATTGLWCILPRR
mgnify:CR=1 FL=1